MGKRTGGRISFDKGSGKWLYKFEVNGTRYRQRGFDTLRAAQVALWAKEREVENSPPPAATVTFQEAVTAYLVAHTPPTIATLTHEKYTQQLGLMSRDYKWATRPLASLTEHDIEGYRAWRLRRVDDRGRQAHPPTVNRDLAVLSALMNWASKKGRRWVLMNPVADVERYDEPLITYQTVTPEQRKTMAEILGDEAVKAALLHTLGVRLSVIFDLRWEQVSFETCTLQYRSKGRDITRVLGSRAISLLRSLHPKPEGYVFPGKRSKTVFRRRWSRARKAIGRPTLRPHDLRVTFGREMADDGVDLPTIRDMYGHTTIRMTERYVGSSRQAQERATQLHDARAGFV